MRVHGVNGASSHLQRKLGCSSELHANPPPAATPAAAPALPSRTQPRAAVQLAGERVGHASHAAASVMYVQKSIVSSTISPS
eukprot:3426476-Prymnesium_polylepis.2